MSFRPFILSAVAAALVVVAGAAATAGKSEEPVSSVRLARTWEAAIDEAKTLNVPIVVHHHGFYCPPCWGMHKSVMCNDKYIEFAAENTVEVIALQDLEKGLEKGERNAAEYDAKDEKGAAVKYLVEFPGLTRDEMLALHKSKASTYNNTGGIPYTCVVNPWTEEEMQSWAGGGKSYKDIVEGVLVQKKKLNEKHGPSISRAVLAKVTTEVRRISDGLAKAGVAKSMTEYRKLEKSVAKEGEGLRKKLEPVLQAIVEAATADLDQADGLLGSGDTAAAKKIVDRVGRALDGTSLETRVKELQEKIKAAAPAK